MYTEKADNFRKDNLKLWENKLLEIFDNSIPIHDEWDNIIQINDILNTIGIKNLNHMLYPDSGGLDVTGCNISEIKCNLIEILTDGVPNICKPKCLVFDSIDRDPEWSYFWLKLDKIEPSGFYVNEKIVVEELYEYNGNLQPYNEYPPDVYYRHIVRVLHGVLLIIPKSCYYNHIPDTYLGEHNKYTHEIFRSVMERLKLSNGYNIFLKNIK